MACDDGWCGPVPRGRRAALTPRRLNEIDGRAVKHCAVICPQGKVGPDSVAECLEACLAKAAVDPAWDLY